MNGVEPCLDKLWPSGNGQRSLAQSIAMSAFGIDVHLRWYSGIFQRHKIHNGIFDMHRIIFGLE